MTKIIYVGYAKPTAIIQSNYISSNECYFYKTQTDQIQKLTASKAKSDIGVWKIKYKSVN